MDRVKLVEGLRKAHDDLDGAFEALRQLAGSAPESRLWRASWGAFDALVQAVAMAIGDEGKWIEWWVWDNDFGRKGLVAGFGEDMRPIESVEDLLWLVGSREGSEG